MYNEAEQNAQVFTFDRKLLRKLKALIKKYPEQVRQLEDHRYTVPKQCIQIREPYSEERKRKLSEKMKAAGIRPPSRSSGNSQGTGNDKETYGKGDEKA